MPRINGSFGPTGGWGGGDVDPFTAMLLGGLSGLIGGSSSQGAGEDLMRLLGGGPANLDSGDMFGFQQLMQMMMLPMLLDFFMRQLDMLETSDGGACPRDQGSQQPRTPPPPPSGGEVPTPDPEPEIPGPICEGPPGTGGPVGDPEPPDRTAEQDALRAMYGDLACETTATEPPEFEYDPETRTLNVDGTEEGDRLRVSYDKGRDEYDVHYTDNNGDEALLTSVAAEDLDRLEVNGRGGDDVLFVDESVNDAECRIEIGVGGNGGDDAILNAANGATLVDGDGNDVYLNSGNDVTVGQYVPADGEEPITGSDAVFNIANGVHVSLGNDGDHTVLSQGDDNGIVLGDGDNYVGTQGDGSVVLVGDGSNLVLGSTIGPEG